MAFKHIGNRAIEITSQNHDVFKSDNVGKPKVLLFTDKAKTPIVFRALSTYFDVSIVSLFYFILSLLSPFYLLENSRIRYGEIRWRGADQEI